MKVGAGMCWPSSLPCSHEPYKTYTPAMKAGVTDHEWNIEDIVKIID
jgi:hypothetical protein